MALARQTFVNDGGSSYTGNNNYNYNLDNLIKTKPAAGSSYGSSGKVSGLANTIKTNYDNLPEAEVTVNNNYNTADDTGGWFYQGEARGATASEAGSPYASSKQKQTQTIEEPVYNYGDYYGTQPQQTLQQELQSN